ncbi:endonuclease MutS2 [Acetobacterium paludosum]|uniref:Endonuclease MutS2 n=1 Tax=Acetobacterium paludosum TaxID=52693 RepID=A0A923I374_9FIRM|nr:endonuclease MutS2 [Acetobacterium paludosum]MBC3889138.1 endonuclease MutS2 [Acetobacterium paludosum]
MDQRSLKVLEYHKILKSLMENCVTQGGKEQVEELRPLETLPAVNRGLDLTNESLGMILRNGRPPLADVPNTSDYVKRAVIGSMLSMKELLSIATLLHIARDMDDYYHGDTQMDSLILLKELFESLETCEELEKEINRKILGPEEMADTASRELARIRREMQFKNNRISEKLNHMVSSTAYEKILQEKIVTIRNNRYVIPVKQEYRSQVPGIVLDKSASGATLYIEPMAVVELNNDIKILVAEEEQEIIRILKDLTQKVADSRDNIIGNYDVLVDLDFQFAKGKYGLAVNGVRAAVTETGPIELLRAKHPLIPEDQVVASDIYFDESINTMVITGPNTGGKTVSLKTIGLLNLMVQSGLFIPVREGSKTRIFKDIFADIGDEQSIEQSLSTFSSHMTNIVEIMSKADQNSLVLFDELGAGTDPTEGAALAISILNTLHLRGVTSISTTHYSELKEFALVTPGVVNASVEFDVRTLRPTYRLLIGVPGKSNAFEIARRLGLGDDIIKHSRELIKNEAIRFEETLIKIDEKRRRTEVEHDAMIRLKRETEELKRQMDREMERFEEEKKALVLKAQEEALEIVRKTREETEEIYREIRTIQETTINTVKDNKELEAIRKRIKEKEKNIYQFGNIPKDYQGQALRMEDLSMGMKVFVISLRREGEIINLLPNENKAMVQSDMIKLKVDVKDLTPSTALAKPEEKMVTYKKVDRHVMNTKLDLRGKNGEESLFLVEKMIGDAMLSGNKQIVIVHGKGTGRLRQIIHEYLKGNPLIEDFRLGAMNEGGSGVTIVNL